MVLAEVGSPCSCGMLRAMPLITAPETVRNVEPAASSQVSTRWEKLGLPLCTLAVLGFVIRQLVALAIVIPQHLALPFQVDYEEGNILNTLVRITHGLTPYPDPHAIPNVLNPYGPVAYYLLAIPVKLLGTSFFGPRLIILASFVAISVFLALIIARQTQSKLTGICFGALYAMLPMTQAWAAVLRVDFLALALAAAGVFVFTRSEPIDNRQSTTGHGGLVLSAVLFAASLLVKHTYLAAPAACMLFMVARREWKLAARFVAWIAGISFVLIAAFAVATKGAILIDLFRTHADPYSWDVYLTRLSAMVAMCRILVVLASVVLIKQLWQRKLSVAAWWLVLASITTLTGGKLGSNWNHFLEWLAALCLCAALGWQMLATLRPRLLAIGATLAASVLLCFFILRQREPLFDAYSNIQQCPQAYQFVAQTPGDHVLSENVGALVLAGKTVWLSNPFVYGQLVMRGGWQDHGFERMLRNREFDLVVAHWNYPEISAWQSAGSERFSPAMLRALVSNYRVVATFNCNDARYMLQPK